MEIDINNLKFEEVGIVPEFIILKCTNDLKKIVQSLDKVRKSEDKTKLNEEYQWLLDAFENWTFTSGGDAMIGGSYDSKITYKGGCGWTNVTDGFIAFNKLSGKFFPYESWRHLRVTKTDENKIFNKDYLKKKAELKSKLNEVNKIVSTINKTYNNALTDIRSKLEELNFVERV